MNFIFSCTFTQRDKTFLFLLNFHIFNRSEKSWEGIKKRKFTAKKIAAGRKKVSFWILLCCCTSTHRDETFLFLTKFHIFSRSEKSGGRGDKEKALHQRTTNDNEQRRTTLTMIIARQDSQNPRANKARMWLQ